MIPRWFLCLWFTFALILFHSCGPVPPPILPASDTLAALRLLGALHVEPVTISVYPQFGMRPATFRVRVQIARSADNRSLCLSYTGPDYYNSCHTIDGEQEPRSATAFWYMRVPGAYTASADLTRIEGGTERHYLARQDFQVLGGLN